MPQMAPMMWLFFSLMTNLIFLLMIVLVTFDKFFFCYPEGEKKYSPKYKTCSKIFYGL
uniref:ATP synthase subunit 8 n=1 Tax=Polyplax spinulosa TaxID=468197 RepID=V9PXG3_9NEOP|nr:ATP synthase subunit 8 [Polyplax spinulosa]